MKRTELRGKVAVVTGAATGIGAAVSVELAKLGCNLMLVTSSNQTALEATAQQTRAFGVHTETELLDVSNRGAVEAFAAAFHQRHRAVDLLVNNAGVSMVASFTETSVDDWQWMLGVNLWGPIHLMRTFIPAMIQRGEGGSIVNVASAAAFMGMPSHAAYAASKAALVSLSESVALQLKPHGISVTAACPGLVKTDMIHTTRRKGRADQPEYIENLTRIFDKRAKTPEMAAKEILQAVEKSKIVAPVAAARAPYLLKRFAPRLLPAIFKKMDEEVYRSVPMLETPTDLDL